MGTGYVNLSRKKKKEKDEGGTRNGRMKLEPS